MLTLTKLNSELIFPPVNYALDEPNGLLAFGGDLRPERLIKAYSQGIFPWFSHDEPIMWWSPNPRGIIRLDKFRCSRSLKKFARTCGYQVSINKDFNQTIDACAQIPRGDSGTWITKEMIKAYKELHLRGEAHSVEVWNKTELVGGLYGVTTGKVFCGESMFHKVTNTSKLAMLYLVNLLKSCNAEFIDCQMQNPHLASLGCEEVPRTTFLRLLKQNQKQSFEEKLWQPKLLEFKS